ncbi:MAG: winged helix-turn-helix domain-containing protein, partial [Burkholderiales bacterium]
MTGDVLRVGDWTVEPALNQLSRAGKTLKLEPKAMAVLRYLAERPGKVVSREALLAAVWPGVVVGDDSVTQAIIKLRKALGDTAESAAYIQTIAKGGYRLVASVARQQSAASAPVGLRAETRRRSRKRRIAWFAAAAMVGAVVLAAGTWFVGSGHPGAVAPTGEAAISAAATRAAQPTISIRPFDVLSEDSQAMLLAQGIAADLATDLSKVFGLSVISAANPSANASAAASTSAAPVRYLVSGSVQRARDRLRLYVHLTDAETGRQLWSERFDRSVADLFAIQDELGPKILQVLPAKVSEAELRRIAQHHTLNLEAYEYFQQGQMALIVRQQAENETAREMFKRAIELDPKFARAYASLALTYSADYRNHWVEDGSAALARAFEFARTAHEINPEVRETYWVLALVHLERRQHEQALRYLEMAVRLSPSFADAYALMAGIYAYTGRSAEALPLLRTAMRLKPEAGHLYYLILGRAYFALGDLEQARLNLEHALLRNPVNLEARAYMAALHVLTGNKAAAAWEAEEIRALQPGFS